MDLQAMAVRIAGYDFKTKMKINALVISELAQETGLGENDVAVAIMESGVHKQIQELADAIGDEAEKLKGKNAA
jgi:hypothetical protein